MSLIDERNSRELRMGHLAFRRRQAGEQGRVLRLVGDRMGLRLDPMRCSTCRSSASTIQAEPAQHLETVATDRAIRDDPTRDRVLREDLRRQGGGELHAREADHQADHYVAKVVNEDP